MDMITRVRGTQDFIDLTLYNYFIEVTNLHLAEYNFTEIATPILEPLELFKRTLGLETDVVMKEMYTVSTNAGEEKIALRPEATASIARAFNNNTIELVPWKVFQHGPMFRHERPQKGRYREFHSTHIEIIGSKAIEQDAYLIKMLDRLFNVKLDMNNYAIKLNFLGCAQDRIFYKEKLKRFLDDLGDTLCQTCLRRKETNIMRVFDCKESDDQLRYKHAPFIADHLCSACVIEWGTLKDSLAKLGVSFTYTPTLVRGLDYYNKTVFEFASMLLGAQDAFCGGGRYDHLIKEIGGREDQPSIGAGIGIERVLLLLEDQEAKIKALKKFALSVIIPVDKEQHMLALLLADNLQNHGIRTDILLGGSLKAMMRKANKMNADFVFIVGEEEQKTRTVTVKIMATGEELKGIPQIEIPEVLKRRDAHI